MPVEALDHKLLTVPTVVVQNLVLDHPAAPTLSLSDYCKLPEVHLEKLQLETNDVFHEKIVALEPKVCLENLSLNAVPQEVESVCNGSLSFTQHPSEDMDSAQKVQLNDLDVNTSLDNDQLISLTKEQLFSKVPVVVIKRYDEKKNAKKRVSFNISVQADYEDGSSDDSGPLIKPCSVILTKQNLEELKESLKYEQLSCHVCGKIYFSRKKLAYHIEAKHDLVQPGQSSKKRVSFSSHVIVHTVAETHYSPLHRCRKCYKLFITYEFLREHMKLQHRKRDKYICDYCQKKFADRSIFKLHIKLHCDVCSHLFSERKDLYQHKKEYCLGSKTVVPPELPSVNEESCLPKIFDCDICKEKFVTRCYLIQHLRTHNRSTPSDMPYSKIVTYSIENGYKSIYTCQYCFESFDNEEKINDHLKPYLKYKCMHCNEKFNDENQLLKHSLTHEPALSQGQWLNAPLRNMLVKIPRLNANDQNADFDYTQSPSSKQNVPQNIPQIEKSLQFSQDILQTSLLVENAVQNGVKMLALSGSILHTILNQEKDQNDSALGYNNGTIIQDGSKQMQMKERTKLEKKHFCMVCQKAFLRPYLLRKHMKATGHCALENDEYPSNGNQQPLLTSNRKYGRLLHDNYANQMSGMPLMCASCEETFAWPELLRDHRCIVGPHMEPPVHNSDTYQEPIIRTLHFEDVNNAMYSEMPNYEHANHNDLQYGSMANHHDHSVYRQQAIDIEVPPLEFAQVPGPLPEVYEVSPLETDKRSRMTRYKLVRQEVPIEF